MELSIHPKTTMLGSNPYPTQYKCQRNTRITFLNIYTTFWLFYLNESYICIQLKAVSEQSSKMPSFSPAI